MPIVLTLLKCQRGSSVAQRQQYDAGVAPKQRGPSNGAPLARDHSYGQYYYAVARRVGKKIVATRVDVLAVSPWNLVLVSTAEIQANRPIADWPEILRIADQSAATEVVYPVAAKNYLWLARLSQSRYWSRSQAHLVARRIAWEHMDILLGGAI